MKIIKEGIKKEGEKRFNCVCCGCVFEAEAGEYHGTEQYAQMHDALGAYNCKCPCCGTVVYSKN